MPTVLWILIWVAVITIVAVLYVRERRSGRPQVEDFDRTQHEAVREAGMNRDGRGPNGPSSLGFG
jgi:cytochrome c-type biogenesis protein CcmH/NrfF